LARYSSFQISDEVGNYSSSLDCCLPPLCEAQYFWYPGAILLVHLFESLKWHWLHLWSCSTAALRQYGILHFWILCDLCFFGFISSSSSSSEEASSLGRFFFFFSWRLSSVGHVFVKFLFSRINKAFHPMLKIFKFRYTMFFHSLWFIHFFSNLILVSS